MIPASLGCETAFPGRAGTAIRSNPVTELARWPNKSTLHSLCIVQRSCHWPETMTPKISLFDIGGLKAIRARRCLWRATRWSPQCQRIAAERQPSWQEFIVRKTETEAEATGLVSPTIQLRRHHAAETRLHVSSDCTPTCNSVEQEFIPVGGFGETLGQQIDERPNLA
jgi:hypothetical protein